MLMHEYFYLSLLFFSYLLLGTFAGFIGGLLGVGGGAIVVPALLFIFKHTGYSENYAMHSAIGTSLAAMLFTAGASAYTHYKEKAVNWSYLKWMSPGIIFGCISGSLLALSLKADNLKTVFAVLVFLTGVYFLFSLDFVKAVFFKPQESISPQTNNGLHPLMSSKKGYLILIGFFIGGLSALLGIGGGIITVPILVFLSLPLRNAIATSAASGFLIALFGALSFTITGFFYASRFQSFGDINIPAFLLVGIAACLTAPIGAHKAHLYNQNVLKLCFGLLLLIIGVTIYIST